MGRKNFDPDKKHVAETMQQYEDVVSRRIRQLADETGCPADQLLPPGLLLQDFENRSKGWRQASIRYQRSALVYWINRYVKDESQKQVLLNALLLTRRRLLSKQTDRRPTKAATSFRDDDWASITAHLKNLDSGSWAYTAGMLMDAILHTGLKPAEWKNARLMWLTATDIQAMGFPLDALKQAIGSRAPPQGFSPRTEQARILDNLGFQRAQGRVWCDVQQFGGGRRGYVAAEHLRPAVSPDGSAAMGPDDSALRAGQGEFDATGPLPCAQYAGQPMGQCEFGVARASGGYATVVIRKPDGRTRAIFFRMGRPIGADVSESEGRLEFRATKERDLHRNSHRQRAL